jgi:hypothetical protein
VDLLHPVDDLLADSVNIGNVRSFAYPDAVVDHTAEMFCELSINLRRDRSDALVEQDFNVRIGGCAPCRTSAKRQRRSGK